jgi:hypothetical protein
LRKEHLHNNFRKDIEERGEIMIRKESRMNKVKGIGVGVCAASGPFEPALACVA